MGIIITAGDPIAHGLPLAVPVQVRLECDEPTEIFCRGFESFTSPDGYIGAHAAALKAGWLERQSPKGRLWLCPTCSGK